MTLWKPGVVLLALLLAAMAMVPMVSAEEQTVNSSTQRDLSATTEHHTITDDYLKDSKPAEWLPESEMITIVISQKEVGRLDQSKEEDIINIPIEFLNSKSAFSSTNEAPSFSVEKDLARDEKIVLIRMPRKMYEQFIKNSHDGILSLPANYFFRYYENLDDLYSHIERDGNSIRILPSDKYPIEDDPVISNSVKTTLASRLQPSSAAERPVSRDYSLLDEPLPHLYAAWETADRAHSDKNYDYCIGQITPVSWTLLGTGNDLFDLFQEREYIFNSNEAIEIVIKHRDTSGSGSMQIFPATWRSGAEEQLNSSEYTEWAGYLPIDKNDLPHSYGYHVGFASGYYTINFEDMDTLQWIGQYRVTSAAGTTSFTNLAGSSEYRRRSPPTTNTFESTTIERDEWARVVNGNFQYAVNVWSQKIPITDQFVSVSLDTDNGRYTTTSHAAYP
jgi:hypothetical protein